MRGVKVNDFFAIEAMKFAIIIPMLYSFNCYARLNVFENSHKYDTTLYQYIFISTLSTPNILINASW